MDVPQKHLGSVDDRMHAIQRSRGHLVLSHQLLYCILVSVKATVQTCDIYSVRKYFSFHVGCLLFSFSVNAFL